MPRAGHIRAWPLPKMLPSGPSAPSPDALHLRKLWRVVSVTTKRRAVLLIVLPSARTPRCSVREKRPVMLRLVGGGISIFDQLLIRVNERLRRRHSGCVVRRSPALGLPTQARGSGPHSLRRASAELRAPARRKRITGRSRACRPQTPPLGASRPALRSVAPGPPTGDLSR
jgi:hypothetical protein